MVTDIGRSGIFLNAISNRLAAASPKSRFLGMIVGTAISQLIERPGKGLRFDLEEMESDEADWYLNLIETKDDLGPLDSIKPQKMEPSLKKPDGVPSPTAVKNRQSRPNQQSKIVAIEEVDEDEDGAEDMDIPYENQEHDGSDDDDDPTLANKPKPTPPV